MNLKNKIVNIMRSNARLSDSQIAAMLDVSEAQIKQEIQNLEQSGVIMGYSAVINEEKHDKNAVTALIELKVSPQMEKGYDAIAANVAQHKQVESVYLMSGAYDLAVIVKGDNLREVSGFVTDNLASMDGVLSTSTHFILQQYKEKGELFPFDSIDERSLVSP